MTGFKNMALFDLVKDFIPGNLKKIGDPDSSIKQINCHGYTFAKDCWYEVKNVQETINRKILLETKKSKKGDFVIYFLNKTTGIKIIKHSGIYLGKGKVRSKWGNGPVFIHDLYNVPFTYGEFVKFFKKKRS